MAIIKVTDASFKKDVMESTKPVLVDFWAEWCGPCRMIGPMIDELAIEMGEEALVAKLNIEDNPETPAMLNIRSIPTLMLFKGGKLVGTKNGTTHTTTSLAAWIRSV